MAIRLDKLAFASILAAVLATACGASPSSATVSNDGVDEGATTVDPTGDDKPGRLEVNLAASSLAIERSTFGVDGKQYEFGHASDLLPVGPRSFGIHVNGTFATGTFGGQATINANATTTGALSLTAVNATDGPVTFGLRDANYKKLPIKTEFDVTITDASDGSRAFPTWPGKHHIDFGQIDGIDYEVAPGETKTVKLTDFATRRVMRLKAPHRENPAARCAADDPKNPNDPRGPTWWVGTTHSYSHPQLLWWLETSGTIDFGVSTTHPQDGYSFKSSAWEKEIDVPLGARGAAPATFALGHLDVNDVIVNNGTKVKGTYDVWPALPDGTKSGPSLLACEPPTGTGVDLPTGKYVVEVKYSTFEAGQKTDVHVVDVTP